MFPTAHKECCARKNRLLAAARVVLVTKPKRNRLRAVVHVAQATNLRRNPLRAVLLAAQETSNVQGERMLAFAVRQSHYWRHKYKRMLK